MKQPQLEGHGVVRRAGYGEAKRIGAREELGDVHGVQVRPVVSEGDRVHVDVASHLKHRPPVRAAQGQRPGDGKGEPEVERTARRSRRADIQGEKAERRKEDQGNGRVGDNYHGERQGQPAQGQGGPLSFFDRVFQAEKEVQGPRAEQHGSQFGEIAPNIQIHIQVGCEHEKGRAQQSDGTAGQFGAELVDANRSEGEQEEERKIHGEQRVSRQE